MRHNANRTGIRMAVSFFVFLIIFSAAAPSLIGGTGYLFAAKNGKEAKKTEKKSEEKSENEPETVKKQDEKEADAPIRDFKEEEFAPKTEDESYIWMILKTIIIMAMLVGGFYTFFRYITKRAGIQTMGGDVMQILSVIPVGQNKFIQIVDVAGRVLLLGISDSGINLITEIKEKDEIDRLRILSTRQRPQQEPAGFQDFITKQIGKIIEKIQEKRTGLKKNPSSSEYSSHSDESGVDMDYLKSQRTRLKKLNGDE